MAFDRAFYEKKSWGAVSIKEAKDLPNLKLRYCMEMTKGHKPNAKLLEIGCGSGRILKSIHERDQELELTGIDLSTEQIALAKQMTRGIDFVQGNGEKLPFADSLFDFVIIMDFLEHIEHPQDALREVSRVLKTGGKLYASVPAENQAGSIYWVSRKIFSRHFKEETVGHIQQYKIKELECMVQKEHLSIEGERFSYHLLGSIMDYCMFTLLLNKKIAKIFWSKNKYYQGEVNQSFGSLVLNGIMTLGNGIAYYESAILKNRRIFSTNVHIVAQRRDTSG